MRTALRTRTQTGSSDKTALFRKRVAAYCVCSTKLLVGEIDEEMFKKLEAGKVGIVVMSLGPALKGIRYVCAKKVWDVRRKR